MPDDEWYSITDRNYKSSDELIRYLVRAAGLGGNLLLNIGPRPDGRIPEMALERLSDMGEWLSRNGETIYATKAGQVAPSEWGVTTRRGNRIYVHVFDCSDEELLVPIKGEKVRRATSFADGSKVAFRQNDEGVTLVLGDRPASVDFIVELTVR